LPDLPVGPGPPGDPAVTDEPLIASPLPYLFAEVKHADRQAREALFCTFNADLGYFERTVLGVTQATGARVTVVADARLSDPDPRAARNAGTRYVYGLAVPSSGAAFHPKVTVIAGPERAVVAIGSGNLSTGGWHLNEETWTIATADRERCPVVVTQLAGWLRALHQVCTITPQAQQGIQRTAALLEDLASAATAMDTGHQLVHNLMSCLLDQLPDGRARQLLVYAPFHDERAEAIAHLIKRLRPGQVALAVQSDSRTVIQPGAVARLVAELDVHLDVIADTGKEYRHGKLVEALGLDGNRWALTGSPNLSARALLYPVASGGNVEVGILSRRNTSLFPDGEPISLSEVPAVRIGGSAANRPEVGVLLLAAVRADNGLQVALAKPPAVPVQVLASSYTSFDQWTEVGMVPAGMTDHVFPGVDLPGGARVRARWETAAGPLDGGVIFVTDPALVMNRPGENGHRGGRASPDPIALISDPRLLEMWMSAVGQLAASRVTTALPRVTSPAAPRGETVGTQPGGGLRVDTDEEYWLAYVDDAKARLGPPMFHFALGGLPGLQTMPAAADNGLQEPTDRLIDERAPGLDEDDSATVNDETDPGDGIGDATADGGNNAEPMDGSALSDRGGKLTQRLFVPDISDRPTREKRRIQRDLEHLVISEPHLPVIDRLAIVSLILCAVQAGIWDSALGDRGWMRTMGAAIESLDQEDIPERISSQVASLAAIAIYFMYEYRPAAERTAEFLQFEETARQTAHLYPEADPELVADYAAPFTNKNGYPIDPDAVMHVIAMIVQNDPLTGAVDLLETRYPAWQIHKHNDALLHIRGDFRATFLPAAEALDAITGVDHAAVWATGRTADWTVAIRHDGTLIRVEKRQNRITWWHYNLSNLISPSGIARNQDLANRARIPHGALNQAFPGAQRILAAIGFDLVNDPPSECPPTVTWLLHSTHEVVGGR
jgi:hypothetical protein